VVPMRVHGKNVRDGTRRLQCTAGVIREAVRDWK